MNLSAAINSQDKAHVIDARAHWHARAAAMLKQQRSYSRGVAALATWADRGSRSHVALSRRFRVINDSGTTAAM
jgi:hypothetical protein